MRCPECSADSGVTETRETLNGLRRRRRCTNGHRFTTHELLVADPQSLRDGRAFIVSQTKLDELKAALDRMTISVTDPVLTD